MALGPLAQGWARPGWKQLSNKRLEENEPSSLRVVWGQGVWAQRWTGPGRWPTPHSPAYAPRRLAAGVQLAAESGGPSSAREDRVRSAHSSEGALSEGSRQEPKECPKGVERGRRQRERRSVKRSEKTETRLPERWMQRDGGQRGGQVAGRQCTLAIHSHCGRHMALSPPSGPQRQSRLSVGRLQAAPGSPTSGRPPGGWPS